MSKYSHKCSCGQTYSDDDPEVYYCPTCIAKRKQIAEEIDKKMASRVSSRESVGFEALSKLGRTMPSQSGGLATFFKASDLGI